LRSICSAAQTAIPAASGANGFTTVVGQASGVPEAPTWAMLLDVFSGLGYPAFRRSRRSGVSIFSE
jgi:hypothetical protein